MAHKLLPTTVWHAIIKTNRGIPRKNRFGGCTMDTIVELFVKLLQMISRILTSSDEEALGWIFGKGAELLDENKDKLNNTDGE